MPSVWASQEIRGGFQPARGAATAGPSSAQNPTASGTMATAAAAPTTTTTPTIALPQTAPANVANPLPNMATMAASSLRPTAAIFCPAPALCPAAAISHPAAAISHPTAAIPHPAAAPISRPTTALPANTLQAPAASPGNRSIPVSVPGFLAPPRRGNRSSRQNRAFDSRRMMEDAARRKVFTSGADQVNKRPAAKHNVEVVVSWPSPGRGFKDVHKGDTDVMSMINRVADDHEAKIDVEEAEGAITVIVNAINRAKAKEIIALLRVQLLHRSTEELWRARLLVNPPRNGGDLRVILQSKKDTTGRRVTAARPNTPNAAGFVAKMAKYKSDLATTLDKVTQVLRHDPNGMRMRVQFGTLILNEWKKDKEEYDLAELGSLLRSAGMRGTSKMLNTISGAAAEALMARLSISNMELPDYVRSCLEGPRGGAITSHSLVMKTKNLVVESAFEPVAAQQDRTRNANQGKRFTFGPLASHQLEKQHRATEVITVCPESIHDWGFEIRKSVAEQVAPASAPFTIETLQNSVAFKEGSLDGGFPNIDINNRFLRNNHIDNVHGKTTLQYILGWKYMLEICLFHTWQSKKPGQNAGAMVTTANVTLFSDSWSQDMLAGVALPRDWDDSFTKQFLKHHLEDKGPGGTATEHMDHLFAWVNWILRALDSA